MVDDTLLKCDYVFPAVIIKKFKNGCVKVGYFL